MGMIGQPPSHDATASGTLPAGQQEWLRMGSVALAIRDLDRVEAFYRDVIGLQAVGCEEGVVHLGAAGSAFLTLLHRPDALPDDPTTAGLFHTAFLLPCRADLGRWLAHSGELGQVLDGAADHLVSEAVYLSDPEGNGVEIYADRPRAQWSWRDGPQGRRVEMANARLDIPGLLREAGGTAWAGAPVGTRIGHLHLRVGNVGEAVRFYGGVLGMDVTAEWPSAAFLSSGSYHHHLAANTWRSAGAGPRDPRRAGLAWATLEVGNQEILAGISARTKALDPTGSGLEDPWGTALRIRIVDTRS